MKDFSKYVAVVAVVATVFFVVMGALAIASDQQTRAAIAAVLKWGIP